MLEGKDAYRYARMRLGFVTYWRCRIADMANNFVWRMRYTIYGQRKTGWGWRLWWEWSAVSLEERDPEDTPQYMADEEIYAATT